MKNLLALTIFFLFVLQLNAQTKNDISTNQYAILKLNSLLWGNYSLNLYLDNNKYLDVFKTLRLDTLKLSDDDNHSSTYALKGLNFMDKEGVELVSSSMTSYTHGGTVREYIFRKKNTAK